MAKKTKTKEKLKPIAKRLFDSNRGLDKLHICANGQGWTDVDKAKNYAEKLEDDNVYTFNRSDFETKKEVVKTVAPTPEADTERVALLARYEELFEKTAPKNIKTETLKAKVDEKEAENLQATSKEVTAENDTEKDNSKNE